MLNQRKLFVSLISSVMLIAVVTIVAADDATVNPETAAQNAGAAVLCLDEADLQNEIPLDDMPEMEQENTDGPETEGASEETLPAETPDEKQTTGELKNSVAPLYVIEEKKALVSMPKKTVQTVTTENLWLQAYEDLLYGEQTVEKLALLAAIDEKNYELSLMSAPTDRIVNYHGTKFAISAEEYEVLLRIVEAEAPHEDIVGRMLVANVILNRVHAKQFPNTITEVVFQKDQFAPVRDGSYYRRKVSEETVEAVERVLAGEDFSEGALYFVARALASKEGLRFFDEKLEKLFKHGGHTFYTEK